MKLEGGCYCGAVRYATEGDALFKGECFCRECQYVSGGGPNIVMGVPEAGFSYSKGAPQDFQRSDLENPVTRQFCGECGTHLLAKAPTLPGVLLLKVGTLDEPAQFGGPQMAIFLCDKQGFHQVPDGVATFDRSPG